MRPSEIELLEDDLDDMPTLATAELGLPIDLAREDLDDEDDLGFRTLYEYPDPLLNRAR